MQLGGSCVQSSSQPCPLDGALSGLHRDREFQYAFP